MRKIIFIAILFTGLFSCENQTPEEIQLGKLNDQVATLEKSYAKEHNADTLQSLLKIYEEVIAFAPDDTENDIELLMKATNRLVAAKRFSTATEYLKRILRDYFSASQAPDAAAILGNIYRDKLNKKEQALTIYQSIEHAFPTYKKLNEIKGKIPPNTAADTSRIHQLALNIFDTETGVYDYKSVAEFVENCELFALLNPSSEKSPYLLFKAVEAANSVKSFNKSIKINQWIYTKFPDSKQAAQALFLTAFTLDNDLHKLEEAKKLYEEFIAKYPDHDFADDTQYLLDNLGKSDDELLKSFEAKQKK